VDQARDRFRAGVANNIEVIQAQDALARANDNEIAALYRFNQARGTCALQLAKWKKFTRVRRGTRSGRGNRGMSIEIEVGLETLPR